MENLFSVYALAIGLKTLISLALVGSIFLLIYGYKQIFGKQIARRDHVKNVSTEGYLAFQNLLSIEENPYPPNSDDHKCWHKGYLSAQRNKKQQPNS